MNFVFKNEIIDYDLNFSNKEKTILFLHGWGGDKNSFSELSSILSKDYNTISLTMPTTQDTCSVWTLNDYRILVENILFAHNLSNIVVVCHSFGFRVACLLKNFVDFKKIIITSGAGPKKISIFQKIKQNQTKIILGHDKNNFFYNQLASSDYRILSNNNKQTFKNVVNLNLRKMTKFHCPVMLFWGKYDKDTKLWIAKNIKRKNKAKLYIVESDHFAYLKHNHQFNHYVVEFLNGKNDFNNI